MSGPQQKYVEDVFEAVYQSAAHNLVAQGDASIVLDPSKKGQAAFLGVAQQMLLAGAAPPVFAAAIWNTRSQNSHHKREILWEAIEQLRDDVSRLRAAMR